MDKVFYRQNVERLKSGRSKTDGLSNCKYTVVSEEVDKYTHLKVLL